MDAIAAGDGERAKKEMYAHIMRSRDDMLTYYQWCEKNIFRAKPESRLLINNAQKRKYKIIENAEVVKNSWRLRFFVILCNQQMDTLSHIKYQKDEGRRNDMSPATITLLFLLFAIVDVLL